MKFAKQAARSAAEKSGYFTTHMTKEAALAPFVRSLRPVTTGHELIRIGGEGDGGYLLPDDLGGITHCFSPGVSTTATFEEAMLERGVHSFLSDYSVDGPPASLKQCTFSKKFLGAFNSPVYWTLQQWMKQSLPDDGNNLLLQMDIEGAEYQVLLNTPIEVLKRFRVIAIEFHALDQLLNADFFPLIRDSFYNLLAEYHVVHLHPNNYKGVSRFGLVEVPCLMEMTFIRKDRVAGRPVAFASQFPHPLDRPNVAGKADLVLPQAWRR
jgi:hypothetical protein